MYSACEDCFSVYDATLTACPRCNTTAAWLVHTYDIDEKHAVTTTLDSTSAEAVK